MENIRFDLLCADVAASPFWKNTFCNFLAFFQVKIKILGVCMVECQGLVDQFQFKLGYSFIEPLCCVRLIIQKVSAMKVKFWKVTFSSGISFAYLGNLLFLRILGQFAFFNYFIRDLQIILRSNLVYCLGSSSLISAKTVTCRGNERFRGILFV